MFHSANNTMSTPTVKELRSKLKELGLETGGRKADLISKLNKASLETKKTPEDEASVIVSNKIRLQNDDAMIANSRQTLPSTIRDEEFYVEYINDDVFVGNRRGISYAYSKSENRTLESRITSLEQSKPTLEQSNATLTSEVSSLSTAHSRLASEVQDLRLSLVDYTLFRNRFLSTYKRKVLKNATPHDHDMINRGSSVAHGGDCRRDAELYGQPGGRRDGDVYRDLYGVSPNIVRALISEFP